MIPQFSTDPDIANAANKAWAIQQLEAAEDIELTTDQKIDQIHHQMTQILTFVENINNQISPIMEQLKRHPLFAAFFGD